MMQYKGYVGVAEIDEGAGIIHGRVAGLRDVITFQGETVPEARKAFEESVDDYLEFCAERGEAPEKPYSGKFLVRIKPDLHRTLAGIAEASSTSLNALVEKFLADRAEPYQAGFGAKVKIAKVASVPAASEPPKPKPGGERHDPPRARATLGRRKIRPAKDR